MLSPEEKVRAREIIRAASAEPDFERQCAHAARESGGNEAIESHVRMALVGACAKGIFDEASELGSLDQRLALADSKSPTQEVRRQVRRLLEVDDRGDQLPDVVSPPSASGADRTSVGPYRVVDELGRGGMGIVYKARHEDTGQIAAVKVMRGRLMNSHFRARFRQEVRALSQLSHPCIVRLLDVSFEESEEGANPYMAMELVEGVSLFKLVRGDGLDESRALRILEDLCDAVHFAHERGIIHRDLKPDNVIVGEHDHPWLLDFGVVHLDEQTRTLTQEGARFGTPQYMSPEQADGSPVDARSDIYSLGVIGFEMLAGEPPYKIESGDLAGMMDAVGKAEPHSLRSFRPRSSRALDRILAKAMAKRRDERYTTAGELADDLREYRQARQLGSGRRRLVAACVGLPALLAAIVFGVERLPDRESRAQADRLHEVAIRVEALTPATDADMEPVQDLADYDAVLADLQGLGHDPRVRGWTRDVWRAKATALEARGIEAQSREHFMNAMAAYQKALDLAANESDSEELAAAISRCYVRYGALAAGG